MIDNALLNDFYNRCLFMRVCKRHYDPLIETIVSERNLIDDGYQNQQMINYKRLADDGYVYFSSVGITVIHVFITEKGLELIKTYGDFKRL